MKNQQACNVELINYTKEGKTYTVSINIAPVINHIGKITHWISIRMETIQFKWYTCSLF
ncbi:hypothetical protein [Pedobacter sp. ok626]|uniref:hypothetical protein n=1 Tax=Pedobacter sp. ok626 TaxID=1761882 RepID=UPI0014043EED|nr:hypothetical protein [Pedobacter sp. ok626]